MHGGKREGSGAKKLYDEPTKKVHIILSIKELEQIGEPHATNIRKIIQKYLEKSVDNQG